MSGGDDLERWRRSQAELAQLFGHDLRSPLGAITANLSYLEQGVGPEDPDAASVFSELAVSCDELLRMIENSEVIGQLSLDDNALDRGARADLVAAVRAAAERVRPPASLASVTVALEAGASSATVRSPAALLDLFARNVIMNGVTHARRNGVVRVRVEAAPSGAARLVMRDPGPSFGDPAVSLSREQQAHLKTTRQGRYSRGLGPYFIGLVARRLGATVAADHDGTTSTLTVTFPPA